MKLTFLIINILINCAVTNANILPHTDILAPISQNKNAHMDEVQFNQLIDKVLNNYKDVFKKYGSTQLTVNRLWENDKINASAKKSKGHFQIKIYGGLGRYKALSDDAFLLVLCHEVGHLIGGAPTYKPFNTSSSEGQADYFSTTKCFRKITSGDDNTPDLKKSYHPLALSECHNVYKNISEKNICLRSSKAQESLAETLAELTSSDTVANFDTPDPIERILILFNGYPSTQCRLDTVFAGSLCNQNPASLLDFKLYNKNVCSEPNGDFTGVRPKCWYAPREDNSVDISE